MKKPYVTILAVLIAAYFIASISAVITYPDEYKVIKTMGKISRVTTEPGFSMRVPLIQSETTISKARQLYDIAPTEIYTSDKKNFSIQSSSLLSDYITPGFPSAIPEVTGSRRPRAP